MGNGEAAQYSLTLTREILPWIPSRFRFRTDGDSAGLGGSSLGGLATLDLGLRHAPHCGKLAVLSPNVWRNHRSILG
jgi:enterochelin esterase-like enzyme